jgi:hypothetical protein
MRSVPPVSVGPKPALPTQLRPVSEQAAKKGTAVAQAAALVGVGKPIVQRIQNARRDGRQTIRGLSGFVANRGHWPTDATPRNQRGLQSHWPRR